MAATTITRDSLTDSTSPTTGDIVNAAFIGSVVYDNIDALFAASLTIARASSGAIAFTVENASNTAGSDAQLVASVAGTSAGDPFATFTVTSGASWSLGVDNDDSDCFKIVNATTINSNVFVIQTGGQVLVGDNANSGMTVGLTLNQGANDNEIFALKSSDIAHGVTTLAETDTYGCILKSVAGSGGVEVRGFSDTGLTHSTIFLRAIQTDAPASSAATNVYGVVRCGAYLASGTGVTSVGANGFLFSIDNNGSTKFLFDAEGDSHEDGTGWTAYDDHDDWQLVEAVDRTLDPRLMEQAAAAFLVEQRQFLEAARIVTFNDDLDGRPFINTSRLAMLHNGALRQLYRKVQALEARLAA